MSSPQNNHHHQPARRIPVPAPIIPLDHRGPFHDQQGRKRFSVAVELDHERQHGGLYPNNILDMPPPFAFVNPLQVEQPEKRLLVREGVLWQESIWSAGGVTRVDAVRALTEGERGDLVRGGMGGMAKRKAEDVGGEQPKKKKIALDKGAANREQAPERASLIARLPVDSTKVNSKALPRSSGFSANEGARGTTTNTANSGESSTSTSNNMAGTIPPNPYTTTTTARPIPPEITALARQINACTPNKEDFPSRYQLAKIEGFRSRDGYMKKECVLREWIGDTRLFEKEIWGYLGKVARDRVVGE